MASIKVVLVGNPGSGKTSVCLKLLNRDPNDQIKTILANVEKAVKASPGVNQDICKDLPEKLHSVPRHTQGLNVHTYHEKYKLCDCTGKEKRDDYYKDAKIVLIFHGGQAGLAPEKWEAAVKSVAGKTAKYYQIKGTLEEKEKRVREILI